MEQVLPKVYSYNACEQLHTGTHTETRVHMEYAASCYTATSQYSGWEGGSTIFYKGP